MPTVQKKNSAFVPRMQGEWSPPQRAAGRDPAAEDRIYALFQPDILVSTQYLSTTRSKTRREPEQRLLLAVLEDAVWCFQNGFSSTDKRKRGLSQEAEAWLTQDGGEWLFSFSEICELLGLESQYLRKRLLGWKDEAAEKRARSKSGRLNGRTPRPGGERRHRYLHAAGF